MSRRGFTLLSVLIATAVTGILAVIIMTIIDNTTRVMVRGNVQESFDGVSRTVASVLANRDLCDRAIRGAGINDLVTFNPPTAAEITNIFVAPLGGNPPPSSILFVNMPVFGDVRVSNIQFQELQTGVGRGTIQTSAGLRNTYKGEIIIRLANNANNVGGSLVRRIPLSVVVNGGNQIEGCLLKSSEIQTLCASMGGTYDPGSKTCTNINPDGTTDCPAACDPIANGPAVSNPPPDDKCPGRHETCRYPPNIDDFHCYRIYYVDGFRTDPANPGRSYPQCQCRAVCYFATSAGAATQSGPGATTSPVGPGSGIAN